MSILGWVIAACYLVTGALKIFSVPFSIGQRDGFKLSSSTWYFIGFAEWAAVAGLVLGLLVHPGFAVAAAAGLVLLMVGALIYRLRSRDTSIFNVVLGIGDVVFLVLVAAIGVLAFQAL